MSEFRTDEMPKDGTPIYIRVIQPYRFLPYKAFSMQAKRGEAGRWQMMNEYGGWDNCPHPLGNEWSLEHPFANKSASEETVTLTKSQLDGILRAAYPFSTPEERTTIKDAALSDSGSEA